MKVLTGSPIFRVKVVTVDSETETTTERNYLRRSKPEGVNDPTGAIDFSAQIALNPPNKTTTVEVIEDALSSVEFNVSLSEQGDEIKDNFGGFYVPLAD